MLKKTLLVASAAIALSAASSAPAFATACPSNNFDTFGQCIPSPQPVPEPSAILGTLLVGGFIGKKALDAKKATK
ncbi:hypothetical protein B6N60_00025 [Richelia sinica FACHB-800]|uniref:PEP-CTERM protein-sorting domain-containing protein n=1 Tax=Richelia sinica FACHB-800 TaxID=1357546 RepID=A0A975T347_9NOST|nr:PEP-CTERM sorting domain-containing protein [Richelia sinica]MBD2665587.1 PEP-CTERM sorting domain-containing protein [Richelia sinica FACHB-800]QXE21351.1 hypothetical protein B6N60_00025 [Richelia sinica FACHB-800]